MEPLQEKLDGPESRQGSCGSKSVNGEAAGSELRQESAEAEAKGADWAWRYQTQLCDLFTFNVNHGFQTK